MFHSTHKKAATIIQANIRTEPVCSSCTTGVSAIEVVPGAPFDPYQHEALVTIPGTDLPEGVIVSELQRGYRIRDRILRPAMVAVAAAPPDDPGPIN